VVDDDPDDARYELLLEWYRLNAVFEVSGFRSAQEAESAFASGLLPDMVQMDFGLIHPSGDQFHLVRRFGTVVPFVGLTGRSRVAMDAADFMIAGGRYVFDKGDAAVGALQERAFLWCMVRLLLREHWLDTFLLKSMDMLYRHEPHDVTAWSLAMPKSSMPESGYDPSYLRRRWSAIGVPPKVALFLFHLYHAYYQCGSLAAHSTDPALRARLDALLSAYHSRRTAMLGYLTGPRGTAGSAVGARTSHPTAN